MMSLPFLLPGPMFLPGGSVSGPMFLSGEVSLTETAPLYGKEWAVRILLECILVW